MVTPAAMLFSLSLSALVRGRQNGANNAGAGASRSAGTHFAHSVTIFASDIDRFVGPESVQSERVMFM